MVIARKVVRLIALEVPRRCGTKIKFEKNSIKKKEKHRDSFPNCNRVFNPFNNVICKSYTARIK